MYPVLAVGRPRSASSVNETAHPQSRPDQLDHHPTRHYCKARLVRVAQLDRASASGAEGRGFESLRGCWVRPGRVCPPSGLKSVTVGRSTHDLRDHGVPVDQHQGLGARTGRSASGLDGPDAPQGRQPLPAAGHGQPVRLDHQVPLRFKVEWSGKATQDALTFKFFDEGQLDGGIPIKSSFGSGIVSFVLPWLFRTSKGIGLMVRGRPTTAKRMSCRWMAWSRPTGRRTRSR